MAMCSLLEVPLPAADRFQYGIEYISAIINFSPEDYWQW